MVALPVSPSSSLLPAERPRISANRWTSAAFARSNSLCVSRNLFNAFNRSSGVSYPLIAATSVFAAYLESFANYYSTYAGLASIVTALFYLYIMSLILIFGAELNAAIARTTPRANRRRNEKKELRERRKGMAKAKSLGVDMSPPANDD